MMIHNGQRFFRVETTSHKLLHRWPSIFQIQPAGEVGGFNARREAWFIQFHSYVIFICPMEYAIQIVISYIFIFHSYSYVICHPKFDTAQWIQLDPNGQYAAPSHHDTTTAWLRRLQALQVAYLLRPSRAPLRIENCVQIYTVITFKYVVAGPGQSGSEVVWNTSSVRMFKW